MKDSERYQQEAIRRISSRIDGIVDEFFRDDCDEEELQYLTNPQTYFVGTTGSSFQEYKDTHYAKGAFDTYYTFPKVLKEELTIIIHDSIDIFKEFVINWYKQKKGKVETDIEILSKYNRILVIFYMMDEH